MLEFGGCPQFPRSRAEDRDKVTALPTGNMDRSLECSVSTKEAPSFTPAPGRFRVLNKKNRRNRRFWDMLPNGQTGQSPAFFEESSFAESDLDPAADGEGCSFS